MPYIDPERRECFYLSGSPETKGELNYVLTMVCRDYVRTHGLSYSTINDVLGAFDGASKEFYRRVAAPYEDEKLAENGDVYDFE